MSRERWESGELGTWERCVSGVGWQSMWERYVSGARWQGGKGGRIEWGGTVGEVGT